MTRASSGTNDESVARREIAPIGRPREMFTAGLSLRRFGEDDLPILQEIRKAAFMPVFQSFVDIVGKPIGSVAFAHADEEQARQLSDLCRATPDQVLVATVDGAIVGFVSFSMNVGSGIGEIGLNAVHPDHAGKGLGTAMYEHVLKTMKASGIAVATVSTGGDPSHAPARRAYTKVGFGPSLPSITYYKLL